MRKVLTVLLMLCICFSSVAQKSQTKSSARRQTTAQNSQKSRKTQNAQKPQNSQNPQKPQKPQKPTQKQQLQAQQAQLKKNIAANKRQKAELEQKVKKQLEDALILGTEIDEQMRVIDTLRLGLDSIDRQITVLNGQLTELNNELLERQKRYANSVRYMHRNRNMQSKMMFILSAKNINQIYRRTRFMNEYSTYQKAQGEAVKQKQAQVEQKREELANTKAEQAKMLARQEQEKQTLVRQQGQKQQMAQELQKQQRTVTALIEQQQKEEAAINAQIDRLIAEEIAREQERLARLEAERKRKAEEQARLERERLERERMAAEKAKEKERKQEQKKEKKQDKAIEKQVRKETKDMARRESQSPQKSRKSRRSQNSRQSQGSQQSQQSQGNFVAADPDARLTGSFASNKGRLPMPITGAYQMVRGFGENVVDGARGVHLSSKGIYLKGQPGAQARCVFDGEVSKIFSTGSSYIVMVRHGRFISVYSDLASVSVAAGQKVSTSQALGRLGPTNIMQFQLRNWTELLNPRNWLRR